MISEYARMIAIQNLADLDCFMKMRSASMEDKINSPKHYTSHKSGVVYQQGN